MEGLVPVLFLSLSLPPPLSLSLSLSLCFFIGFVCLFTCFAYSIYMEIHCL